MGDIIKADALAIQDEHYKYIISDLTYYSLEQIKIELNIYKSIITNKYILLIDLNNTKAHIIVNGKEVEVSAFIKKKQAIQGLSEEQPLFKINKTFIWFTSKGFMDCKSDNILLLTPRDTNLNNIDPSLYIRAFLKQQSNDDYIINGLGEQDYLNINKLHFKKVDSIIIRTQNRNESIEITDKTKITFEIINKLREISNNNQDVFNIILMTEEYTINNKEEKLSKISIGIIDSEKLNIINDNTNNNSCNIYVNANDSSYIRYIRYKEINKIKDNIEYNVISLYRLGEYKISIYNTEDDFVRMNIESTN